MGSTSISLSVVLKNIILRISQLDLVYMIQFVGTTQSIMRPVEPILPSLSDPIRVLAWLGDVIKASSQPV